MISHNPCPFHHHKYYYNYEGVQAEIDHEIVELQLGSLLIRLSERDKASLSEAHLAT